ncbi:hypothetical protein MMC24_001364 [Lignoscripta atroalba]|nr:hypothetical protein [Lignoscripta atroalba]
MSRRKIEEVKVRGRDKKENDLGRSQPFPADDTRPNHEELAIQYQYYGYGKKTINLNVPDEFGFTFPPTTEPQFQNTPPGMPQPTPKAYTPGGVSHSGYGTDSDVPQSYGDEMPVPTRRLDTGQQQQSRGGSHAPQFPSLHEYSSYGSKGPSAPAQYRGQVAPLSLRDADVPPQSAPRHPQRSRESSYTPQSPSQHEDSSSRSQGPSASEPHQAQYAQQYGTPSGNAARRALTEAYIPPKDSQSARRRARESTSTPSSRESDRDQEDSTRRKAPPVRKRRH